MTEFQIWGGLPDMVSIHLVGFWWPFRPDLWQQAGWLFGRHRFTDYPMQTREFCRWEGVTTCGCGVAEWTGVGVDARDGFATPYTLVFCLHCSPQILGNVALRGLIECSWCMWRAGDITIRLKHRCYRNFDWLIDPLCTTCCPNPKRSWYSSNKSCKSHSFLPIFYWMSFPHYRSLYSLLIIEFQGSLSSSSSSPAFLSLDVTL